jgi:hypothetical protein
MTRWDTTGVLYLSNMRLVFVAKKMDNATGEIYVVKSSSTEGQGSVGCAGGV